MNLGVVNTPCASAIPLPPYGDETFVNTVNSAT